MRMLLTICVIAVWPHTTAWAQWLVPRDHYHRLSYGLVLGHDQAREDLLTPLRWAGPSAGVLVALEVCGGKHRQMWSLIAPLSLLQNRYGHRGYALSLAAEYAYERDIGTTDRHGSFALGGSLRGQMHNGFYESWDDEHLYWLTAYSIGPRIRWTAPTGRGVGISAVLELPLVAAVSRPPEHRLNKTDRLSKLWFHLSEPHKNLEFTTVPDYASLHTGLALVLKPRGHSTITVHYDFEVSTYDSPERVVLMSNRLSLAHRLVL